MSETHDCKDYIEYDAEVIKGYGAALESEIVKVDGHWIAGNGEYGIEVKYCPWCGIKLN